MKKVVLALAVSALLAGCSGGGDDSEDNPFAPVDGGNDGSSEVSDDGSGEVTDDAGSTQGNRIKTC